MVTSTLLRSREKLYRGLRPLHAVIFIFAAIFVGRAVISDNQPWRPISEYEHIQWQRTFQGRILLAPVLRWAASSPIMTRAA